MRFNTCGQSGPGRAYFEAHFAPDKVHGDLEAWLDALGLPIHQLDADAQPVEDAG